MISEVNKDIPIEVLFKYAVQERNQALSRYEAIQAEVDKLRRENESLRNRMAKIQGATDEAGNVVTEEQYKCVKARNKKLAEEVARLRGENSDMVYKVIVAERKSQKPKSLIDKVKYVMSE